MGSTARTLSKIGYEGSLLTDKISSHILPGWKGKHGYGRIFNESQAAVRKKLDQKWGVEPKEVSDDNPQVAYEGEELNPDNKPPEPTPKPVTPMPDPDVSSQQSIASRRRSVQAQLARRGRMSTILSQSEPLGA